MEAKLFHSLTTKPPLSFPVSSPATRGLRLSPIATRPVLKPVRNSPNDTNQINQESDNSPPTLQPQITPPPEAVEVRFRRRSKRRSRMQRDGGDDVAKAVTSAPKVVKKWEEMSVGEKVLELYVGEKGALYWLNKFAYASIFIVIGGWIVFRFVGPSLNLYQLDSPPLAPESLFKGSP